MRTNIRSILLIISGSVAAYKSLELIRRLREQNVQVHSILTAGGAEFIPPLAVSSLTGSPTYTDLFSLRDEVDMGHIRLSREADAVLVAPASADIIAKLANGMANDLATTALLATDKPVIIAPAMNHRMWEHASTQRNIATLRAQGIHIVEPESGDMACGETGKGRFADTPTLLAALNGIEPPSLPLAGKKALVTSGPTYEPVDPVRFIGNRSSGKQGHAIAAALAQAGAEVTLITGPSHEPTPAGVAPVHVQTAEDMLAAAEAALPADIAVCAAAVSDWRPDVVSAQKIKKIDTGEEFSMSLIPNPDILKALGQHAQRPSLLIGFAAETNDVLEHAKQKLASKGCDWLLANDVSGGQVFSEDNNTVWRITRQSTDAWPTASKRAIAQKLVDEIIFTLQPKTQDTHHG